MTLRYWRWALLSVLTLTLLAGSDCHATQILPRTTAQLAEGSQSVVLGTVLSKRSFWNDAGTRILTEIEIEVEQSFKGSAPSRVKVVQMGGVVGTTRMTVAGALGWSAGEQVLLFLEPSLPGSHRVTGFSQGKFQLERDRTTGEWMARRPALLGIEFAGASKSVAGANIRIPLSELLEDAGLRYQEEK